MIRVLIVADVRLYRDGLTQVLERRPGFLVVGSAPDAARALGDAVNLSPDVVLLDMTTPAAAPTVRVLAEKMPSVRIVGLAVAESEENVIACIEAGVSEYVARDGSLEDLVATMERSRDEMVCPPRITRALARRVASLATAGVATDLPTLSRREQEVVALIDRGLSNKEIAQDLNIEVTTVKQHVHSILEKLQVHTRGEAAARLRRSAFTFRSRALGHTV